MRDGFIFYRSFYEALENLPRDIQGEVFTAIMEYGLNGITTENLKPVARSIFTLIKPQLDKNNQRYENGKKGGNPNFMKGKKNPYYNKEKDNREITKTLPTDNQKISEALPKEKDKVKDNVKEKDKVKEVIPPNPPKGGKGKKNLLELVSEEWRCLVEDWLNYKTEKKQSYKSAKSVKTFEKKLKELSGENLKVAQDIIERSIANNWAGIFELKVTPKTEKHPFTNFKNDINYEEF